MSATHDNISPNLDDKTETSREDDDIFDSITMAEERFQKSGFVEGLKRGQKQGYHEGYLLGHQHGTKLGSELGFYCGFTETLQSLLQEETDPKPRKVNALKALLKLIDDFPMDEPENPSLQEKMQEIRAKFKQVCSLLKVVIDYDGASAQAAIGF